MPFFGRDIIMNNLCEYVSIQSYNTQPICKKTGEKCFKMRRCSEKLCWLPVNNMKECKNRKNIPDGKKEVLFLKNGYLYYKDKNDNVRRKKWNQDEIPEYI